MQAHTKSMKSREETEKQTNKHECNHEARTWKSKRNVFVSLSLLSVENICIHSLVSAKILNVLLTISFSPPPGLPSPYTIRLSFIPDEA